MYQAVCDMEDAALLKMISGVDLRILDVGCGQGRYLVPLSKAHDVVGIDSSQQQVSQMQARGFNVLHSHKQLSYVDQFDYIIMSHIIEHIQPASLVNFFNTYLSFLKSDGYLVIATPLLHKGFYDDYDHVKPYTPRALQILFSDYSQQQEKPDYRLRLVDLWMRRWPYKSNLDYALTANDKKISDIINQCSMFLFHLTGSRVGELTGWVGKFSIESVVNKIL